MPRTRKPAGTTADRRNGRRADLTAVAGGAQPPDIDRDLYLPEVLVVWDAYWSDTVTTTQSPADKMMALTWLASYNDYLEKRALADASPLVKGSMGQLVANPMYQIAHASMQIAMQCARQLGIGARNRADLGLLIVAEAKTLAAVNEKYRPKAQPPAGGDDDDPRVIRLA